MYLLYIEFMANKNGFQLLGSRLVRYLIKNYFLINFLVSFLFPSVNVTK